MAALIAMVVDGRLKLIAASAMIGFVVGVMPGTASMQAPVFIPLWLKAVIPAVILGVLINRGSKAGWSFAAAAGLIAVFVFIMYLQRSQVIIDFVNEINDSVEHLLTGTAGGASDTKTINRFIDEAQFVTRVFVRLLPGMMILSGIMQLFIAFLAAEWYFTRRDGYFSGFGRFIYWKVPEKVLYFLGVVLIVRLSTGGAAEAAADNVAFVIMTAYSVCGLALIEFGLRKLRLSVAVRVLFYLGLGVLLIQVFGLIATAIAGMFDSYFDFRKVRARTIG
jgi:uncharacterized protein YybS (DUF2232 family)